MVQGDNKFLPVIALLQTDVMSTRMNGCFLDRSTPTLSWKMEQKNSFHVVFAFAEDVFA